MHRPPSSERSESETKDAESLCQTKTACHDDPLLEEMEEESNIGATGDEASNSTKKHLEPSTASERSESETKDADSLCQTKRSPSASESPKKKRAPSLFRDNSIWSESSENINFYFDNEFVKESVLPPNAVSYEQSQYEYFTERERLESPENELLLDNPDNEPLQSNYHIAEQLEEVESVDGDITEIDSLNHQTSLQDLQTPTMPQDSVKADSNPSDFTESDGAHPQPFLQNSQPQTFFQGSNKLSSNHNDVTETESEHNQDNQPQTFLKDSEPQALLQDSERSVSNHNDVLDIDSVNHQTLLQEFPLVTLFQDSNKAISNHIEVAKTDCAHNEALLQGLQPQTLLQDSNKPASNRNGITENQTLQHQTLLQESQTPTLLQDPNKVTSIDSGMLVNQVLSRGQTLQIPDNCPNSIFPIPTSPLIESRSISRASDSTIHSESTLQCHNSSFDETEASSRTFVEHNECLDSDNYMSDISCD